MATKDPMCERPRAHRARTTICGTRGGRVVLLLAVLAAGLSAGCENKGTGSAASTPSPNQPGKPDDQPIDMATWKPDPSLPKPEIKASVEIIKEQEKKKISMKVTATESNGLTVHEVHFKLKYRELNPETKQYTYPENMSVPKMIPKLEKGKAVFTTPIVEPSLRDKAWTAENDNWEVEIVQYGAYFKG